ncbi:beta-class carbonic anhydrase [Sulfobacillus harzensis]|uniref:carbonic anhydrase n=1 Tax=Sulfobacillus harzensis TaxID=2729629 RepID=A0A7Y0L239_9FIRM|nr:carbonic anhydrase [Sulfobacillus harzensis]NMP21805.1 carbonic anhydrase [Sulfobacillus harzensis]
MVDIRERIDEGNRRYQADHAPIESARPSARLAVLTCMDARIDPLRVLGLHLGEVHVLRNAGARVTEDMIRSLAISQQALGTDTIVVMPHTGCGVIGLQPDNIHPRSGSGAEAIELYPIRDLQQSLQDDLARLRNSPWLRPDTRILGAIFDIKTGALDWV